MKLKSLTLKTIEVAAAGGAALFAAAMMSAVSAGAVLFISAPFVPDPIESAIKGWVGKSVEAAAFGGLSTFVCALMHFHLSDSENDEATLLPEPVYPEALPDYDAIFQAEKPFQVPLVCCDCQFVNPDNLTRSLLLCGVRPCPEHSNFCPDKQPVQED